MLAPGMVNDDRLATLAEKDQIKKIYVFDEKGAVTATNSVYKYFKLSTDKKDQSHEFWDIIRGYRDSVIQKAAKENGSGECLPFVDCKRKDAGIEYDEQIEHVESCEASKSNEKRSKIFRRFRRICEETKREIGTYRYK